MRIHEFSGEGLEQMSRESFVPVVFRARPDFRVRMALQEMGEAVTLSRAYSGGPHRNVRTERLAARTSGDNVMVFIVHVAGQTRVHQRDRFAELAVGTGVLSEARSPWEIMCPTESQCLILCFSRELLPLRTAEITESCARSIDPVAPSMQMLSGYLSQLLDVADRLTAEQRLDAGRAAIDLLAMALRDVAPSVPGGDGAVGVLLDMMRTHVRDHLADPRLGVVELARRHHVSIRRAYSVFERIGTTPGAYLRGQRLLAARAMLSDPRYARLGISSVAAAVGFLDRGSFDRAFRREYGMTPGGWRREHLPSGSAPQL
ncbi:helix-turn-helix domain-containing protein [Pseudonocardia sp. CA-142604]|uniref:helix-turn-helix domain-containing protein n=1 Tax=Pseudonocardia sp. CA-142604 TaxID=3240024 RepID=UPI003D8E5AB2